MWRQCSAPTAERLTLPGRHRIEVWRDRTWPSRGTCRWNRRLVMLCRNRLCDCRRGGAAESEAVNQLSPSVRASQLSFRVGPRSDHSGEEAAFKAGVDVHDGHVAGAAVEHREQGRHAPEVGAVTDAGGDSDNWTSDVAA